MSQQLIFSVTNDLCHDQRMIRICTTLSRSGYNVTLVGRRLKSSPPLQNQPFRQKRLPCLFTKGPAFYAEFNLRLLLFLLTSRASLFCAIDLDTILPVYLASRLKKIPRVFDAHELFCEMKEVVSRRAIHKFWKALERRLMPKFKNGYTVNHFIAAEFNKLYGLRYEVIRNLPVPVNESTRHISASSRIILYQGAVNEARCFETLIPAMKEVDAHLVVCGDGNFMKQAKQLTEHYKLQQKITFKGYVPPHELPSYTSSATVGVNIIEDTGLNNRYSLSNRFFDYIQSALPQVCVDYPAYREVNDEYHCALLIPDTSSKTIAHALNTLLNDASLYKQLKENCNFAKQHLNWNIEEQKLIAFYKEIIPI